MASAAAPSTLNLPPPHSQDLHRISTTPSSLCFRKPTKENPFLFSSTKTFFFYPLVLQCSRASDNGRLSKSLVAAALATEADLAEEGVEQQQDDGGGVAVAVVTKPKKGKAALLLKRDRTRSKRFLEIQKLRENKQEYDLKTAISLLKQTASTKFVETVEAHFRLNIDPKYNDQQLRATVNLPKGTGQTVKVAVLTQGNLCIHPDLMDARLCWFSSAGEKFDEAKNAGADIVGGEDLIEQIKGGFMDFDKLIATPDMMPKLYAVFLLMPTSSRLLFTYSIFCALGCKPGKNSRTTRTNAKPKLAIEEFKKGKVEYRADKTGIVHLPFGKADFSEEDLLINFLAAVFIQNRHGSGDIASCSSP
ncbi:hypothetical protein DH2020_025846 [Rehmannia glutinosa]|uniref:Ribosomal protein n=1 Tax=Rehmannia glutinosa TaxID=99300 RepID=A0ABR0W2Y6_REHGL